MAFGHSTDVGQPARTVWQIISDEFEREPQREGAEEVVDIHASPQGRVQVKARVVRDRGRVTEIRFERLSGGVGEEPARLERILSLDEAAAERLTNLCLALKGVDPSGDETQKFDGEFLAALLSDSENLQTVYGRDPEKFRNMIECDVDSTDVIALAARRSALSEFERLLNDPAYFDETRAEGGGEAVWQRFFEENPWVLGVGLSGHLLTSWDEERLEQVVAGFSVGAEGKRVDALMTTTGLIRSLVFAELKRHDDPLLGTNEYRPGCWAPSKALSGGVAQAQVTTFRAAEDIKRSLDVKDAKGYPTGEQVFLIQPRSYLVVGSLASLTLDGRAHVEKFRSFELFRRNLNQPEVLTYDEVLARAKWALLLAERTSANL
jgi:hypothetical protein